MRERLIEILSQPIFPKVGVDPAEVVADYLLDNGVIVPPCKVGETLYAVTYDRSRVVAFEVRNLSHLVRLIEDECFGEWVFTTEAEAEKALRERSRNERK